MNLDICDNIAEKLLSETNTSKRTRLFAGGHDVYSMSFSFTKHGIKKLLKTYGYLKPFIDEAVDTDIYNFFWLNSLIIGNGNEIKRHHDSTIEKHTGVAILADRVTVLYVKVPSDMIGGNLRIYHYRHIETVTPEKGKMVTFKSHPHSVDKVTTDSERISLVLESYYLDEIDLAKVPNFWKGTQV